MEELDLMYFLDQVERLGELAELAPVDGLDFDGLQFADFWANVEEPTT